MAAKGKRIVQFSEDTVISQYNDESKGSWEGWDNPFNDDNLQEDAEDILSKLKTGSLLDYGAVENPTENVEDVADLSDETCSIEERKIEKVTRKSFKRSYYFFGNYEKLILKIHKACQIGFQLYQDVRKVHGRKHLLFSK